MHKIKSIGVVEMPSDGVVEGYAATFDHEPDSDGDIIRPGAFARTLAEWAQKSADMGVSVPLLYGHNTDDPAYNIGKVTDIREDEHGLYVVAEFDADSEKAQYVRKLAKEGRLYQFSFAYSICEAAPTTTDAGGVAYELIDLDLYEVSLVQIPANQNAVITGVKSAQMKYGRRNSKADADELSRIGALADEIKSVINGLIADDDEHDEPDESETEEKGNAEDPETDNAKDPNLTEALAEAKRAALLTECESILTKIGM